MSIFCPRRNVRHLLRVPSDGAAGPASGSYEYIVVGSGAGGGPLASRLALAGHSVLLIEAGDNSTDTYQYNVPALHALSSEYAETSWDFYVRHYDDDDEQRRDSKLVYTLPDGTRYWGPDPPEGAEILGTLYPRAGTLGGCTAHNAIVTIYPNEIDWTNIQQLTGDDSWAPENMRGYFEKLEKSRYLPNSIAGHGFDGWLSTALTQLTLIVQDLKIISLILGAATAMGQSLVTSLLTTVTGLGEVLLRDINNPDSSRDSSEGLYQVPLAMKVPEYKRAGPVDLINSVVDAKFNNGTTRYPLTIALNTLAIKIVLDTASDGSLRASGVEFLAGKSLYGADPRRQNGTTTSSGTAGSVTATREVIISGGAYNTPQLLKLSGIGPRKELENFDIDVKLDLPGVGKNLQDHHEIGVSARTDSEISLLKDCNFLANGAASDPCIQNWEKPNPLEKGVYATNGVAIASLIKSSVAENDTTDLFVAGWPAFFKGYEPFYFETAVEGKNAWTWVTLRAHTRNNNGSVTLRSADPTEVPNINFRLFTKGGEQDLQAMVEGQKYGRKGKPSNPN